MGTTFTFVPARERPVWSTAPLTTRMVSPYRDRTGRVHIFADSFDPSQPGRFQDRLSSWAAVQRYYSTADFERFDDHGVVVGRGRWSGDPATSDADCVGAGSPGVTVAGDRVLLFYAGRGPADPAGPFAHSMNRADLPGQIMLAIAPADADGAPADPFVKQGAVTDYGAPWRSIRHDDPRPVVTEDEILLFFKGIGPGDTYANRVIGLARTPIDRPAGPYAIHPEPVLRSDRGCESPRVFRFGDEWHMFVLRYSTPGRPGMRRYGLPRRGPVSLESGQRRRLRHHQRPPRRGRGRHVPRVDPVRGRPAAPGPGQPHRRRDLRRPRPVQAVAVGDPRGAGRCRLEGVHLLGQPDLDE